MCVFLGSKPCTVLQLRQNKKLSSPLSTSDMKSSTKTKAKRIACVECRQQKSKCNAQENAPSPCSRCQTRGLVCTLKPEYKRTYKRARNAQLESAYNELRQTLNGLLTPLNHDPSNLLNADVILKLNKVISSANALNSENQEITNLQYIDAPEEQSNQQGPPLEESVLEELLACEPKTYQTVSLSSEKIKELFTEFAVSYHPILPVVDIQKGPEKLYRLCPGLFWVIILTALRRYSDPASRQLFVDLSPLVKSILEGLTISPITRYSPSEFDEPVYNASSVYSVQAFLIFTMWPPLASSLSADSSWNTIGIALFQAVRIGLHSPGHTTDFGNAANIDSRQLAVYTEPIRTWISCNIVSQTASSVFGYPAFTSFDHELLAFLHNNHDLEVPIQIRYLMEIADFENQIVTTLTSTKSNTEKKPLIKILAERLEKMELEATQLDYIRKFAFLMARVHLYTYHFLDLEPELLLALKQGLIKLYNSCISLISHCQVAQTDDKKFMKYLPGVYVIQIWQAAFMIAKIAFSPLKSVVDFEKGKNMYQVAIYLTLRNSVIKYDMAYRFSGIMQSLWQLFDTLYAKHGLKFELSIRSRMAASVFFDCLLVLRQKSGMTKFMIKRDIEEENSDVEGVVHEQHDSRDDDDDYPDSDGSSSLDEKIKDIGSTASENTSENVVGSQSDGSHPSRKSRILEDVILRPENSARKIIKTIPLDPTPIRNALNSAQSSPANEPQRRFEDHNKYKVIKKKKAKRPHKNFEVQNIINTDSISRPVSSAKPTPVNVAEFVSQDGILDMSVSPLQKAHETNTSPWDSNMDLWNSDLNVLLKDVSTVMNDFGFHDVYNEPNIPVQNVSLFQQKPMRKEDEK